MLLENILNLPEEYDVENGEGGSNVLQTGCREKKLDVGEDRMRMRRNQKITTDC